MESQLHRQEDPQNPGSHSVIEGEREQENHGEKKSMFNKVKDKAKKIKDTIKHGHGHGHEHEHEHEGGYEDEDDEEEEGMVKDPAVHGAPTIKSTVIRSTNLPKEHDLNVEKPVDTRGRDTLEGLEEDPHSPNNTSAGILPSNSQLKVANPTSTGGKEAEVTPLVREFGSLNVRENPEAEHRSASTGNRSNTGPNPVDTPEDQELNPKTQDPAVPKDIPQDTVTGKISSAASAIANKALSAKNVVASKLGYGGDSGQQGKNSFVGKDSSEKPASESSATQYAHKVAEKLAPVYGKVAGVGSAVMSKVHGQGGDTAAAERANKGASMNEYLAEKFRPGDEDKALSEVITDAFHKKKKQQPKGKVTESEEVAARLGRTADSKRDSKREGEDAVAAGSESSGQGVIDRVKDAVSLWLGKSDGAQTAQESAGKSFVSDAGSGFGSGSAGKEPAEEAHVQPTNLAVD